MKARVCFNVNKIEIYILIELLKMDQSQNLGRKKILIILWNVKRCRTPQIIFT